MEHEKITYTKLRDKLRQEKETNGLTQIEEDFYKQCLALIKELEKKAKDDPEIYYRDYENVKRTFDDILSLRLNKIIESAKLNAGIETKEPENMIRKERELYNALREKINDFKESIRNIETAFISEEIEEGKAKIKIKKYIPLYINQQTKKTYGPYNEGQVVIIEKEEAEILVNAGYAEYVN